MERLQKFLANAGVASRRKAEEMILDKRVSVNGKIVTELGVKVSDSDKVLVDGALVKAKSKKIYIALNKPKGFITTASDEFGRRTVMELVSDEISERIYPVGRLDADTTGLLIMSNDGDFTYKLSHPKHEIEKVYIADVEGIVTIKTADKLRKGVFIEDYKTAPAKVEVLRHFDNSSRVQITIHEGKKRQVRKMFSSVGHEVIELTRIQVGPVMLGNLPLGRWRHLRPEEIKRLIS